MSISSSAALVMVVLMFAMSAVLESFDSPGTAGTRRAARWMLCLTATALFSATIADVAGVNLPIDALAEWIKP